MLVVKLNGGLGNQMFNYAVGRYLSLLRGCPLTLDLSFLENAPNDITPRNYELGIFPHLAAPVITKNQKKLLSSYENNNTFKAYNRLRKMLGLPAAYTHTVQTWSEPFMLDELTAVRGGIHYLSGFWQNEYYFKGISDKIRHEFSFPSQLDGANKQVAEQIAASNAVSLHIRRGDYITEKVASQWLNVCSIDYYTAAIAQISRQINAPTFFIFSDDIEWVKQNITIPYPCVYVEHNKDEMAFEDMRLMSLCQHNIIANSTFSWWGAWLNANVNKIVIAPAVWLEKLKLTGEMMVPFDWQKI